MMLQATQAACPPCSFESTPFPPLVGTHTLHPHDPNYYFDTSATHHMTRQSFIFSASQPYNGPTQVYLDNGDAMNVTHTDTFSLTLGPTKFHLHNVFLIPELRNLLYIAPLTDENFVF